MSVQASKEADSSEGKKLDNDTCKSDLHRWVYKPPVRTCALFNEIQVKLAACGEGQVIIVSTDYKVFSVGSNEYGQLGLGDRVDRKTPREISFLTEKFVNRVACGSRHSCAISKKGQVFCWGDSRHGQCGQGEKGIFTTPCRVRFVDKSQASLNDNLGSSVQRFVKAQEVSCGDQHTMTIDTRGCLWSWGTGLATGHGLGDDDEVVTPTRIKKMHNKRAIQISCGKNHSVALIQGDAETNPEYDQSDILSGSMSDDGEDSLSRTDSNVTQKIPFFENVFYVEDEEDAINWSMDLPKLHRTDTPPIFDKSEDDISVFATNLEKGDQKECSDETAGQVNSNMDSKDHENDNDISQPEANERTLDKNQPEENERKLDEIPVKHFENKLFGQIMPEIDITEVEQNEEDNQVCVGEKSKDEQSSSDGTIKGADMSMSLSQSKPDSSVKEANTDNCQNLTSEKNIENSLGLKDIHLVEASTNDLYYSALDIVDNEESKNLAEGKSIDSLHNVNSNSTCSSETIGTSSQSLTKERTSSNDPLSLSIDKSMENIILSESCSVVKDETEKFPEKVVSEHEIRSRATSTWSIATTGSSFEVDKIGSVQLFGVSQVWAWGDNKSGQLGIGDSSLVIQESSDPVCVTTLKGHDIVYIAAGSVHTLALTTACQVFGWGDNTFGQLGLSEPKTLQPQRISALKDLRVWDIAGGDSFSVFLADVSSSVCGMYQLGESMKDLEGEFSTSCSTTGVSINKRKSFKKIRRTLHKSKKDSLGDSMTSEWYIDTEIRKVKHFEMNAMLRTVEGSDGHFLCITASDADQIFKVMYKLASSERYYHYQLCLIQEHLIDPLQKTETWVSVSKQPGGEALFPLIDCFTDVLLAIGVALSQLTDIIKAGLGVKDLFSFFFSDSFRAGYDRYSKCYCDSLAVGHLHSLSKAASNIVSKVKEPVKEIFHSIAMEQPDLAALMKIPLKRASFYLRCVEKLTKIMKGYGDAKAEETSQLKEVSQRWQDFSDLTSTRLREAEKTREFWEECPAKLVEALKDPHRRILRTSKNAPLSLARASRLASHSFMLFNDVFVHCQSSRHFQVFPLVTMWVEPFLDSDQQRNALRITAPEVSSVLVADSPAGRTEWVKEINEAIAQCLSVASLHRITTQSVNSISGLLRAADAREASYTYINHVKYKSARYSGMWLHGMPHGRGKMVWPDNLTYEGEFENGNFQGYGVMVFPVTPSESKQRYEGDWMEGKMQGYGQMKYHDGSEYVGHWENDCRNGHGTTRTFFGGDGTLETVYVGNWQNDQKHGYGVQDFVVRGEKYIGMWLGDQRHGYGIVVTVDGVYYEGRFVQNKLAGRGILLSDDDTCYEGEFTADMQMSGKGVLTLPNGDYIEGQFHGNWGGGIKVNGVFNKFANPDPILSPIGEMGSSQMTVTDFTIPAGIKWKSLFEECREELVRSNELLPGHSPSIENVWKNVEKSILKTRASDIRRRSIRRQALESEVFCVTDKKKLKHLIDIKEIQTLLTTAMNTFGHPLSTLVEGLVEVYRATYVGVGAHRRLLLHAVEEAKSYISRLYTIIRIMFPSLPDEEFVVLTHDKVDGVDDPLINSTNLLHPLILPRLYPPLFTLYALHTEKGDAIYAERLHQLNKRGDIALMSFLGVNRKFLLCKFEEETKEPIIGDEPPYKTSIAELDNLITKYSPMEKIEVIRRSFAKIHEEVNNFWKGEKKIVAMDDLFPVFQYVVTRARVPHLGSEVQFIEDMVDPSHLVGEMGHMVTTLKACYFQIQNEKDRD
ncbi:alsin-like [Rhopilema esculentum]|uniref:alsin-like n=1 Tax=Rhopilema esculentum TaxID=499914 RepID=UPI0031D8529F